jgi:hypothetical protein
MLKYILLNNNISYTKLYRVGLIIIIFLLLNV